MIRTGAGGSGQLGTSLLNQFPILYAIIAIIGSLTIGSIFLTADGPILYFNNVSVINFNNSNLTNINAISINQNLTVGNNVAIGGNLSIGGDNIVFGGVVNPWVLSAGDTMTGDLLFDASGGPNILNEGGSATNPTLIPNKANTAIGIGGAAIGFGTLEFITNSISRMSLTDDKVTVNEEGDNLDFRVEGVGQTHALFVDGANGRVGINKAVPAFTFDIFGNFRIVDEVFTSSYVLISQGGLGLTMADASGGIGIALKTGGGSTTGFNERGLPIDFRIKSDNNLNMFFVDGSADGVGIGTNSPLTDLHVSGDMRVGVIGLGMTPTLGTAGIQVGHVNHQIFQNGDNFRIIQSKASGAELELLSAGGIEMMLDLNNNDADRTLRIAKDSSTNGAGITLFNVSEDGNVVALGNIISDNVFIPQYLFAHTNENVTLASANVWANITFSEEVTDLAFGIDHNYNDATNHTFTINEAGDYDIHFDIDIVDTSLGASDVNVAARVIFSNGTEIAGSVFETDIIKQDIEVELSHSFLARISANDVIVLQFTADDVDVEIQSHGTFGDHPDSANIVITKIANI